MKIYTKKQVMAMSEADYERGRGVGFRDAVDSVIKAIESGDKVILGNDMAFVGMTSTAPITAVGENQHWMNSLFTMDPKFKRAGHKNLVKICGKL